MLSLDHHNPDLCHHLVFRNFTDIEIIVVTVRSRKISVTIIILEAIRRRNNRYPHNQQVYHHHYLYHHCRFHHCIDLHLNFLLSLLPGIPPEDFHEEPFPPVVFFSEIPSESADQTFKSISCCSPKAQPERKKHQPKTDTLVLYCNFNSSS